MVFGDTDFFGVRRPHGTQGGTPWDSGGGRGQRTRGGGDRMGPRVNWSRMVHLTPSC